MIAKIAYILNLLSLKRLAVTFFLLSPLFLNQGERVSMRFIYTVGYLFAAPVAILGMFYGITKMFGRLRISLSTLSALGLLIFSLISIAVNTPEYIFSPFWHFVVFFKMLIPMGCFFVLKNCLDDRDLSLLYSLLVLLGIASFVFLAISFVLQIESFLISHYFRFALFFDDANEYSCFMAVIFGMTFPVLVKRYLDGKPYFGLAAINSMLVLAILASGSRTGMLLCMAIYFTSIIATRNRRIYINSLIILLPIAMLMVLVISLRYTAGGKAQISDMLHAMTFRFAWEVIQKHPLVGVGLGNITEVYAEKMTGFYPIKLVVHCTPLGVAADIGIPGMLCWLSLICIPGWGLLRRIISTSVRYFPHAELVGLNVIIVYLLGGLFLPYDLLNDNFWAYLSIPYIILNSENITNRIQLGFRLRRTGKVGNQGSKIDPELKVS